MQASTRRVLQTVQEGIAQKLLEDSDAWAVLHSLKEHCHLKYPAASHSTSEASRRLATMHVIALGVHKAWCDAWSQQMTDNEKEGSGIVSRCEKWILAAVCDMSRALLPAADFAAVPAVPAAADEVADASAVLTQRSVVTVCICCSSPSLLCLLCVSLL